MSNNTDNLPDQEGLSLAKQRETELQSHSVQPLTHSEFLRRTNPDATE
ncbi:MAG: hypothetical protein O3A59_14060 [Nitrospirae bacterium]|nr:hypothetical protein [Nitrospirota bacterium]